MFENIYSLLIAESKECIAQVIGVGIPCLTPALIIAPVIPSDSRGKPARTSTSMEVVPSSSIPDWLETTFSRKSSERIAPSALPTSAHSTTRV